MKKVLVLMLVLGMATLANAGLLSIVGPNGETTLTVAPGATITGMQATYTGDPSLQSIDIYLVADALNGVISNVQVTAGNRLTGMDYIGADAQAPSGLMGWEVGATNDTTGQVLVSGQMFTFDLQVLQTFTMTPEIFGLFDNVFVYTEPTVAGFEAVVPEPATMLILGLGGLLLRRK